MSYNFGKIDLEHIDFPVTLLVDYVRIYQPLDAINIGCNPDQFPTSAYIEKCVQTFRFLL